MCETHRPASSDDIHAAVCAGLRDLRLIAFGLKGSVDQPGKVVPGKLAAGEVDDLIGSDLVPRLTEKERLLKASGELTYSN